MTSSHGAWREHGRQTLTENPWFAVHRSDVELPSGRRIAFHSIRTVSSAWAPCRAGPARSR